MLCVSIVFGKSILLSDLKKEIKYYSEAAPKQIYNYSSIFINFPKFIAFHNYFYGSLEKGKSNKMSFSQGKSILHPDAKKMSVSYR